MGRPGAVNSNPSTAFKAKGCDLMTQSQENGASLALTFTAHSHGECRRRPLPVENDSINTTELGVVTNPACLHAGDCEWSRS
jgi:hypothetical protein